MCRISRSPCGLTPKRSRRIADNLTANLQTQIRQVYYHIGETENWRILLQAENLKRKKPVGLTGGSSFDDGGITNLNRCPEKMIFYIFHLKDAGCPLGPIE